MKHLRIPKRAKGKGEQIYCTSCNRAVNSICKKNNRTIRTCPSPESHSYKASYFVPGSDYIRITKQFRTRDYYEFKRLKNEFFDWLMQQQVSVENYKEVRKLLVEKEMQEQEQAMEHKKQNKSYETEAKEPEAERVIVRSRDTGAFKGEVKPLAYKEVVMMFLDHMAGKDDIAIKSKKRSDRYILELKFWFRCFAEVLTEIGHNAAEFPVDQIGDKELMAWHRFLEDSVKPDGTKRFGNHSYNKGIVNLSRLFQYLIHKKHYDLIDPFKDINRKSISRKGKNDAIYPDEFAVLLKLVTEDNGWGKRIDRGILRNVQRWRPWLKSAFRLGIETGERRDGIALMRWSDIDMKAMTITIINHKVSNIMQKEVDRIIPITIGLEKVLMELGYEEKKDTDEYIIDPTRVNRKGIMEDISRGFTHFWKMTGIKKKTEITFKRLRKTYATLMYMYFGDQAGQITGQTIDNITRNYVDQRLLMLKARKLTINKVYEEVSDEYDI